MTDKAVVFSAEGCEACEEAKEYLREKGLEIEEKDALERAESNDSPIMIKVPRICVGEECVTGFDPEDIDDIIE